MRASGPRLLNHLAISNSISSIVVVVVVSGGGVVVSVVAVEVVFGTKCTVRK